MLSVKQEGIQYDFWVIGMAQSWIAISKHSTH